MWLAILALLDERPMHPYEMSVLMKQRRITASVKLNAGSLYANVNALLAEGFIAVKATEQDGKMPERTIYQITPEGSEYCFVLLREILKDVEKEFPRFGAGLSFIAHIAPDEAASLLKARMDQLKRRVEEERAVISSARAAGISELFVLETGFSAHMAEAELAWVTSIHARIEGGEFSVLRKGKGHWAALASASKPKGTDNAR
ncbi:PadR family transcriptional regulator [Rugamonas sp. A1-17]|nr:PadR family transcriptional regulator [Rugamonas sp. A1-17]